MSAATALARVGELEQLLAGPSAPSAAPAPAPAGHDFPATLARASALGSAPAGVPAGTSAGADVPYGSLIDVAAARNGVDPALLRGLIRQESGFDPNAGSPAGARGLTQLMPATAAALGVSDPADPAQSIEGGARYLRQMLDRFGGDASKALAGYNAGPGAVQRYGGMPPYAETRNYVQRVLAYADSYRAAPASPPIA